MPADLDAIEETMLIPVWARARETHRPDAIIRDAEAARLAAALPFDFARFEGAWKTQVGVAVRTRFIDAATRDFLARNPDGNVVHIGAGLDTRFRRVDNGRITWFDLDTPEASAFRRRHLSEASPRYRTIEASAFDADWMDHVPASEPVFFIAEGVFMFFPRDHVTDLFERLAVRFPRGEMMLDCIGRWMVHMPWLHDTLPATRARFAWGLASRRELEQWSPRYAVVATRSMLDETPRRWRWMRWLRFIPGFADQFIVAHLRFS